MADAFDGVSASGERLSTRERVLSGALGVGQVALEVVGAKGAGQLSKRAGREVGEKVNDLWRGAKNWWRGADDVADAGKGGRFGGTQKAGAKPTGEVATAPSNLAGKTIQELKEATNDLPWDKLWGNGADDAAAALERLRRGEIIIPDGIGRDALDAYDEMARRALANPDKATEAGRAVQELRRQIIDELSKRSFQ